MVASLPIRSCHHRTGYIIGNLLTPRRIPSGHRNQVKSRESSHAIAPKEGGRERTLGRVNDQQEANEEENVNDDDDLETDAETMRF